MPRGPVLPDRTWLAPTAPPRPLSSFVGRSREIEELRRVLERTRLLTLTGAGGCGKTRLAIALVGELGPRFPAGVAFADLGSTAAPAPVEELLAGALDAAGPASVDPAALIAEAHLLLVLDGAEHVLEGVVPLAEDLLDRCPNLRILATSREPLNLIGEVRWQVPPLALPSPEAAPDLDRCGEFDAVRLFTVRASEHAAPFRLTAENAGVVVEICRRLDGMPLALELAAARVATLGLGEVARRLVDSLRVLAHGPRNAVPRQRTMRATIDWSHDLLDESERAVFRRLSVFADSFDVAAVEAVCSGTELAPGEVVEALQRLVDKSLVVPHSRTDGGLRYRLMEVVRQYARERLVGAGETDVRARHAGYYAELAARLADRRNDPAFTALMNVEYDNLRLALDWAEVEDAALRVGLVLSLSWLWDYRGLVREARERTETVLAGRTDNPDQRAWLLVWAAHWSRNTGDLGGGRRCVDEAFALLPQVEDDDLAALVLNEHAFVRFRDGDLAGAQDDLTRALALLESRPPTRRFVITLNNLSMVQTAAGKPLDGLRTADRALVIGADVFDESRRRRLIHTRGVALMALHRVAEARECFLRALASAAGQANYEGAVHPLTGLAWTAADGGRSELCLELLAAARRCARIAGVSEMPLTEPRTAAAEQASRSALRPRAAEAAWNRGARMDIHAALDRARGLDSPANGSLQLPPRKLEVVRLVAAGLSNKEIARRLSISQRTVEGHLDQLRNQLGFRNRAQLAVWAASQQLLERS